MSVLINNVTIVSKINNLNLNDHYIQFAQSRIVCTAFIHCNSLSAPAHAHHVQLSPRTR